MNMTPDFIHLDEAARQSGLHRRTLLRHVRTGVIYGRKTYLNGRVRWEVSVASLWRYADPETGELRDKPGPKRYLQRWDDGEGNHV